MMVDLGKRGKEKEKETPPPEHNLPPLPTWGKQRHPRCSETDPTPAAREFSGNRNSPDPNLSPKEKSVFVENKNHPSGVAYVGIDTVSEKATMDLKAETDRIRVEMLGQERSNDEREVGNTRPWKLRDRRVRVKVDGEDIRRPGLGTVRTDLKFSGKLKEQRPEFSMSLSRSEVEEDFAAMVGNMPPKRPKKRRKTVQERLDKIFPGLCLPEITPDIYKVDEAKNREK